MSSITPSINPSVTINWQNILKIGKEIKGFFESIDKFFIGTGLVYYDETLFKLLPRSKWFNKHKLQWVTNIGNKNATFEATQKGLSELSKKVNDVKEVISQFIPFKREDCTDEVQSVLLFFIGVQIVIDGTAKQGLQQLCDNYLTAEKKDKSQSINQIGNKCFENFALSLADLKSKYLKFCPEAAPDIQLESFAFKAKDLLQRRVQYENELSEIKYEYRGGVYLPASLIESCRDNVLLKSKPNKEAVLNAVREILIPKMAHEIPSSDGIVWTPMRLQNETKGIIVEQGVTGTCERLINSENICNFYYRIDPSTSHLVMSCGAFHTPERMDQMAFGISKILPFVPDTSGRWMILQLNSHYSEEVLIQGVRKNISSLEKKLKTMQSQKEISLMHYNMPFNAATMLSSEDEKSEHLNITNLYFFIDLFLNDLNSLFNTPFLGDPLHHLYDPLKESLKVRKIQCQSSTTKILNNSLNEEESAKERSYLIEKLKNIYEILQEHLKHFKGIKNLREESQIYLDKGILLIEVFSEILDFQCKITDKKRTRCNEIEMILFLCRLLDIKPIITCWSGLDRSGFVRAMADALAKLERKMNHEAFDLHKNKHKAELVALRKIFHLLINIDVDRQELFSISNPLLLKLKEEFNLISDLSLWDENSKPPVKDIQQTIRSAIDQKYPPATQTRGDDLKTVQDYLDRIFFQLMGVEQIKTLFSCGVIGLKYHQNAAWIHQRYFANPHPLERLPQFALTNGNQVIKLLRFNSSPEMTPAGMDLILRLSNLRGK